MFKKLVSTERVFPRTQYHEAWAPRAFQEAIGSIVTICQADGKVVKGMVSEADGNIVDQDGNILYKYRPVRYEFDGSLRAYEILNADGSAICDRIFMYDRSAVKFVILKPKETY